MLFAVSFTIDSTIVPLILYFRKTPKVKLYLINVAKNSTFLKRTILVFAMSMLTSKELVVFPLLFHCYQVANIKVNLLILFII